MSRWEMAAVDWVKLSAVLQGLGGIMQGVAALVVLVITWRGISVWRDELRSKRKQELAEETLSLAYRLVDGLEHMRLPFVHAAEMNTVERPEGVTDEEFQLHRMYGALEQRFTQHEKVYADFLAIRYRVAAVFGAGPKALADKLLQITREVRQAVPDAMRVHRAIERLDAQLAVVSDEEHRVTIAVELQKQRERLERINKTLLSLEVQDEVANRMALAVAELNRQLAPAARLET